MKDISKPRPKKSKRRKAKLSRLYKPEGMSLEQWQIELRKQFGREQKFRIVNAGDEPVFSEFDVTNPQSSRTYRVTVRGRQPGDNHCTCADFATNTLGTCKHIEFTLGYLERRRGAAGVLRAGFEPAASEVYLHYGARREVRFRPGRDRPAGLARLVAKYFDESGTLRPESFAGFDTFLAEAVKLEPDLRCTDDVHAFVAEVHDAEYRRQRVAEAFPRGIRSAAFKDLVNVQLYDYQREGVLFAARAGRCLIGDEMGLGKTVQAIAAAEIMARLFGVERVLVICPTSLKHQWRREIERFCDRPSEVINGLRPKRQKGYAAEGFYKITNYDTVHADLESIESWGPDLVILDEAQRIKNWATRTARSVKRIETPYALVLTGTPLENRLEELISIVQFVDRFRLGPTFRLLHDHQVRDPVGKVVGYRALDRIGQTLEPILLRRQKDQVLDQLPERIDSNLFLAMTPQQMALHTENREIVARIVAKWRRYRFLSEADKLRLMSALQRMRMSCDSSYLVDHETDHGPKADEAVTLLGELLERPGTKVVVFSQWLRMHDLLARRLKVNGIGHVLFHGQVPGAKRRELIDRFRDDPDCRVFLSTDAGGVGLNLQFASAVMNMDLPWNPAVLEQRIGRVHRLGQKQPVRVVNFVAKGTIEEGMLGVLKFKQSLFSGVLDGGEANVSLGGTKLTKFMEAVEAATAAIPETLIEEAEQAEAEEAAARAPAGPEPSADGAATDAIWSGLLQSGMALLQQVASASRGQQPADTPASLVRRDEKTGEAYLRLPVPKPELVEQALRAVGALLEGLKR